MHISFYLIYDGLLMKCEFYRFEGRKQSPRAREIQSIMKQAGINASYAKANRARLSAEVIVRGKPKASYSELNSWLYMLKQLNPGTHTAIQTDSQHRFKYCFWAVGAWMKGLSHLRKVCLL